MTASKILQLIFSVIILSHNASRNIVAGGLWLSSKMLLMVPRSTADIDDNNKCKVTANLIMKTRGEELSEAGA
jgi:hypothetical protein